MSDLLPQIHDVKQEYIFGRDHAALLDLSSEGWIRATGPDTKTYLHKMTSNDIEAIKDGAGQHGLYLTAQGKILSELHVYQTDGKTLYLQVPNASSAMVLQRFDMFVLNNDVTLENLASTRVLLSVQGPKSDEILKSLGGTLGETPLSHTSWDLDGASCVLIRRVRFGGKGFDLVIPKDQAAQVAETVKKAVEEHGGGVVGSEGAEVLRVSAAVPAFGKEINDEILPQEAYLEQTAISFDKGCYPGQETVAKIKYRGRVNRHLVKFEIDGETVPEERPVVEKDGKKVGLLTSAIQVPESKIVGLGYVKNTVDLGSEVDVLYGDNAIKARVSVWPYAASN
ncbi:MAG: glycine cleavage T C-terminal barrel domain-containing protein [Planctomycetota bacterium]|nr:glycine cleavage T C-terminal barrel domain-containing protein [Planctomycetota bacterium]